MARGDYASLSGALAPGIARTEGTAVLRLALGFLILAFSVAPAWAQRYSAEGEARLRAAMAQFVVIAPVNANTGSNLMQTSTMASGGKPLHAIYLHPDKAAADTRAADASEVMVGVPGNAADALIGAEGAVAWISEDGDVFGAKVFFLGNDKGQELTMEVGGRAVVPYYVSPDEARATQDAARKALGDTAVISLESYPLDALIPRIVTGAAANAYLVSPAAMYAWAEAYGRGARLIGKDWQGAGN